MVNPGRDLPGPLEERTRLETTREGVEQLLRAIYTDEHLPVRKDLLDRQHSKTLEVLINAILAALQPVTRESLCPRVWIRLTGRETLKQLQDCTLSGEARLSGEAEAFRQLGLRGGDEISFAEFCSRSEFNFALDYFAPQVANCMRRIMERYPDLWVFPPVSLVGGVQPKVLVPAYVEKGINDSVTFEFFLYQPELEPAGTASSAFDGVCNLFLLAWSFRKRILDDYHETFLNLQSRGHSVSVGEIRTKIRKFKLVFGMIILEALHRKLDSPRTLVNCFPLRDHQEQLERILDSEPGTYATCRQQLAEGIEANSLDTIVGCLNQLRTINRTILLICTARLQQLVTEMAAGLTDSESDVAGV